MPLIPTAPINGRAVQAGPSAGPITRTSSTGGLSKKRKRDDVRREESRSTHSSVAGAGTSARTHQGVLGLPPKPINAIAGPSTHPAQIPLPIPKPPRYKTHNRLPPPKPHPTHASHISTTNPIREQEGLGKARDVIYVTSKTSLGAYLFRCKSLLVDQGLNRLTLHAMTTSIPHCMILLHALLEVLPYPADHVRYELRTSTVECVDEMLVGAGVGEQGERRTGRAARAGDGEQENQGHEKGNGLTGVSTTDPAPRIPPEDPKSANLEGPAGPEGPTSDTVAGGEAEAEENGNEAVDVDDDDHLLQMMLRGVSGVAGGGSGVGPVAAVGGEVEDAGFRVRNKSALEIVIRIGKPPHLPAPIRHKPTARPATIAPSISTRYANGEPVEKMDGVVEGMTGIAEAVVATSGKVKSNTRPKRLNKDQRMRARRNRLRVVEAEAEGDAGQVAGSKGVAGAEPEEMEGEEAMMNAM